MKRDSALYLVPVVFEGYSGSEGMKNPARVPIYCHGRRCKHSSICTVSRDTNGLLRMSDASYDENGVDSKKKRSQIVNRIALVILGSLIPISYDLFQDWHSGSLKMNSFQDTLARVDTTQQSMIVKIEHISEQLRPVEQHIDRLRQDQGRIKQLEEDRARLDEARHAHELRIKDLETRMQFYHAPGQDKDRRTIEEWQEWLEQQERRRENRRGYHEDSWDGIFRQNQRW